MNLATCWWMCWRKTEWRHKAADLMHMQGQHWHLWHCGRMGSVNSCSTAIPVLICYSSHMNLTWSLLARYWIKVSLYWIPFISEHTSVRNSVVTTRALISHPPGCYIACTEMYTSVWNHQPDMPVWLSKNEKFQYALTCVEAAAWCSLWYHSAGFYHPLWFYQSDYTAFTLDTHGSPPNCQGGRCNSIIWSQSAIAIVAICRSSKRRHQKHLEYGWHC